MSEEKEEIGASASPTGLSSDDGAASVAALRASIPSADSWGALVQRLTAFAHEYCRKQASLGMLGAMAWVLGVDLDFKLVPRASAIEARSGETRTRLDPKDESATHEVGDAQ